MTVGDLHTRIMELLAEDESWYDCPVAVIVYPSVSFTTEALPMNNEPPGRVLVVSGIPERQEKRRTMRRSER